MAVTNNFRNHQGNIEPRMTDQVLYYNKGF